MILMVSRLAGIFINIASKKGCQLPEIKQLATFIPPDNQ